MEENIFDMENNRITVEQLENKIYTLQDYITTISNVIDEMWKYHPENPDFKNPITECKELKKLKLEMEGDIQDMEVKLNILKNVM